MGVHRTDTELYQIASIYKTRREFKKYNKLAYQTAYRRGMDFLDGICIHMTPLRHQWSEDELVNIATTYQHPSDFEKYDNRAYQAAKNKGRGFLSSICSHMTAKQIRWTSDDVISSAQRFLTRGEWRKHDNRAYGAARRMGILDKVCNHMTPVHETWTDDNLRQLAAQYETRGDFATSATNPCEAARRRGHVFFDDICSHMKKASGSSDGDVLYIWKAVGDCDDLYKVGVTSSRLGVRRIKECASDGNFQYIILLYEVLPLGAAFDVEGNILTYGSPTTLLGFSGYSEFRHYTVDQIDNIIHIVKEISLKHSIESPTE